MSNVSQSNRESHSLDYSVSSSGNKNGLNYEKLSDSLQYLDRIRSINKKVFDDKQENKHSLISPLQKLVHSQRQITYIDNDKVYGIIKIQILNKLKARVQQLQTQQQNYKQTEHSLKTKNTYLKKQLTNLKEKQSELNMVIQQITTSLDQQRNFRQTAETTVKQTSQSFITLTNDNLKDSTKYLALLNDFEQLKAQNQGLHQVPSSHQMICQTQTHFYRPTIEITPFEPNLSEILRKLREKQGEKVSRQTLKQIVTQSLDAFVKELDSQYKLIHEQTIDLTKLREENQTLIEENDDLKKKLDQLHVEQEKLKIFRNCMTEFLNDTTQNVNKSIEAERIRKRIYEQLSEEQRSLLIQGLPSIQVEREEDRENPEVKQLKVMKENMEYLKKENIELLRTIGEYQHKMKKVERVLDENKKEEIPDDGTVGQLVKMSKLVKQSIKSLLQEL